jgi:hypothetical protein
VPKQNHSKLLRKIAQVAITAPTPPIAVPSQKPGRRPIRAISSAAGIVAAMTPACCTAIGRVDNALSGVSMLPTIAPVSPTMLPPVMDSAWQPASISTVRRVLVSIRRAASRGRLSRRRHPRS